MGVISSGILPGLAKVAAAFAFTLILAGSVAIQWPLEMVAPPAVAESILGDVNGDGTVDSIDAFLLLQFHAGIIGFDPPYREKNDVNHDQSVDALDAVHILQFHAGILASLDAAASSPNNASIT